VGAEIDEVAHCRLVSAVAGDIQARVAVTVVGEQHARLFAAHHGKYGSPRLTADRREAGWRVSENTVATLMREQGLVARAKKRRKCTTRQGKGRWRAPDLIGRVFPAAAVNRKWYGDGTESITDDGKLYLDSVLDRGTPHHRLRPGTTTPNWPTTRW
jgi:transposase InsO family protein